MVHTRAQLWARVSNFEEARAEKNLFIKELAEKAGMSFWHVSKVANGSCPTTVFSAHKLCKILDKKTDYLFERR